VKQLEALKEPESQFRNLGFGSVSGVEFLQAKTRLWRERCRKLENERNFLKSKVAVLGRVAKLMWVMTMTMVQDSDQDVEDLRENVAMLGAVAQDMFQMTQEHLQTPQNPALSSTSTSQPSIQTSTQYWYQSMVARKHQNIPR
jgi:hypothetical protein